MYSILLAIVTAILLAVVPGASMAAPLKTYVPEFSVTGAPNKDELKVTLQGMLTSRLNPNQVQLTEKQDQAELLVSGSYALFGRMFSLDVLLKNTASGTMTKIFEQGDGQDDLIPAIGRLAQKIERELSRIPASPAPAPAAIQAGSYTVRPDEGAVNASGSWSSEPLTGVFSGIALGRTLPSGEREIFVANDHSIRSYLKGADLKLVAEATVPMPAKILAIDTADLDGDGVPELYVTILDREAMSSRVYRPNGAKLELIAENLPWIFRGIGQELKTRTIYVQEMGLHGEFYGGVAELAKTGDRFKAGNPLKLPRIGNIFNFNTIKDPAGKSCYIVLNEDGYLVIVKPDGDELWKSSDTFGGSENYYTNKNYSQRTSTDVYRWTFLEQRMVSLPGGIVLVPRNEDTFAIGNHRSYRKHTMFALQWTGSILKEKWHSRPAPTYLADYAYDPASREVVLLEVIQKEGLASQGKTVISINRID